MRIKTVTYTSPVDAFAAICKRLSAYENQYSMKSEDFFHKYQQGQTSDDVDFMLWAVDYRDYLELYRKLDNARRDAE